MKRIIAPTAAQNGFGGTRMTVEILRFPTDEDWLRCKKLALGTVGKDTDTLPQMSGKKKY